MKKLFRKLKIKDKHLLVVMIILCVGLMLVTFSGSSFSGPFHSAIGTIVMPLERGVNKAGSVLVYLASGFKDVQDLNEENENLRKEIAELTETNNRLSQQISELERLEELYKLDSQYSEYNKVAANVIAKDPGTWYSTYVIDKGTDDGISVDMNVIAGGGLVGIVTETGKSWAVVQSIIDDRSNISAMIASTSDTMVVSGNLLTMEQGTIDFSELRDPDNVVGEGTTVVTSNISTKYLTGLLVGYVSRVEESSNRLTKKGTIIPAADFMHLREVLVITNLKQTKGDSE